MKKPSLKTCRRTLQIGTAAAFILIPLLNRLHVNILYGNFLSFNAAGLTLADPLAVLQITLKNRYLTFDLLIGAGIALALALFLGTVFCSWVCPFGLLSELVHGLGRRVLPKKYIGLTTKANGIYIKVYIFGLGLLGFIIFSVTPVLNQLSMPAWYSRIFQFLFVQKHLSLAIVLLITILLVEFAARNRLWCRYVCPQAFLLILFKLFNPLRLKINYDHGGCLCKPDREPCLKACSLSLNPKAVGGFFETECTNCGDCIVACKRLGRALGYKFYPSGLKNMPGRT